MIIYAHQNETLDEIAYRTFGLTHGIVEKIYQMNPKLCEKPARLPKGTPINIPHVLPVVRKKTIKLWD